MDRVERTSGALIAAGPLLALLAVRWTGATDVPGWWDTTVVLIASAAGLATAAGGWLLTAQRRPAMLVLLAAGAAFAVALAPALVASPSRALVTLSAALIVAHLVRPAVRRAVDSAEPGAAIEAAAWRVSRARSAAAVVAFGLLVLLFAGGSEGRFELAATLASLVLALALAAAGLLTDGAAAVPLGRRVGVLVAAIASVGLAVIARDDAIAMVAALALGPAAAFALMGVPGAESPLLVAITRGVLEHPARLLAVTFLLLATGGTLLLELPMAAAPGRSISLIDAVFTATSAVCVNGLVVLDTATAFSPTGHVFLLLLIQLGGLGIMSFSTAALAIFGRRLGLRHEAAVAQLIAGHRGAVYRAVGRLLAVTFSVEAVGALLLWPLFVSAGDGVWQALWRGVFTSVSAFCNAGFALQSDSLVGYHHMPAVLHVIALLIIAGGLSPAVVLELPRLVRRKPLSVHARVVLSVTAALLAGGAIMIAALEWGNSLGNLSYLDRLHGAWFQSVTLRTAGFNTVDFGSLRSATMWLMLVLMFIGGSPGSTAGGVKTTTVAVLFAAVRGAMAGRWQPTLYGRRISQATVAKAAALMTIASGIVVAAVAAVEITQPAIPFDRALFEVVSALSTAGLTAGATPLLDGVGKVLVTLCMFVGRIGPLTLFLFLRGRHVEVPWTLPETELEVG